MIAQPDERYESYCRGCDFIREHIFPGGHLPSMGAMVEAARGTQVGLGLVKQPSSSVRSFALNARQRCAVLVNALLLSFKTRQDCRG